MYEFHPTLKTDLVLNSYNESWNAKILQARDKPPVILMETLRRTIMKDFQERRREAEKHECPMMSNVLDKITKKKAMREG